MAAGKNVRGALVGRNVHHPGDNDPAAVAAAVYGVIHESHDPDEALEVLASKHGANLDYLTKVF